METFTDLDAKKQGPAICLSLTGKACEAPLELSIGNLDLFRLVAPYRIFNCCAKTARSRLMKLSDF